MVTIEFATDNEAFQDDNLAYETARILREVAKRIVVDGRSKGACIDINGNTVGKWEVSNA